MTSTESVYATIISENYQHLYSPLGIIFLQPNPELDSLAPNSQQHLLYPLHQIHEVHVVSLQMAP